MRQYRHDLLMIAVLFLLPLVLFWQQTIGGQTLLPTENLYQYEPYATYREIVSAPDVPHNHLLSDLVLQNFQWKSFIRQSIDQREVPLWNPHQFSGIPFMAAGQQSMLYPLSLIYYVMPLPAAYGWFTVVNLWLAGVFMYALLRGLGVGRTGGLISGITYQLCGFFVASAVFPMIIGAVVWMPLLLLMTEFIIRQRRIFGRDSSVPWVVIGAGALACNMLAGHVEITIYTLLILAFYAAGRLFYVAFTPPPSPLPVDREGEENDPVAAGAHTGAPLQNAGQPVQDKQKAPLPMWERGWGEGIKPALWLIVMVALGLGLGAIQFIPLYEFANTNWRAERSSLQTVLGYAHPARDVLQYLLPNFYGSPAHHDYFDIFQMQTLPVTVNQFGQAITHTEWGIKNYVEGALYVGILPLALAVFAVVSAWAAPSPLVGEGEKTDGSAHRRGVLAGRLYTGGGDRKYIIIFALLTLVSLSFMFGLPTYAAVYILPGINQLNSPFRWVFGVTLGIAVLAGLGAERLFASLPLTPSPSPTRGEGLTTGHNGGVGAHGGAPLHTLARRFGYVLVGLGIVVLVGLLVSRVFFAQIEPLLQWLLDNMAGHMGEIAGNRFADARMFYSYQFGHGLVLGVMLVLSGVVFLLSLTPSPSPTRGEGRLPIGGGRPAEAHTGAPLRKAALFLAPALIAVDLLIASWGFNPASDPLLLDFTPPSIQWLLDRQAEEPPFRYTTLDAAGQHAALFQPNMTMRYGLDDIRGYDSIIPVQYVDYMRQLTIQPQLDFNRIAPLYMDRLEAGEIEWGRLNLLNVRYIITHQSVTLPENLTTTSDPRRFSPPLQQVYEDEAVRIWRNNGAFPRVFIAQPDDDAHMAAFPDEQNIAFSGFDVTIERDTGREKLVNVDLQGVQAHWLVISETYAPGWRAYIRPRGSGEDAEKPLDVHRVLDTLQGVRLNPNELAQTFADLGQNDPQAAGQIQAAIESGEYTLRLVYSPTSFQVGLFGTVISAALAVFLVGVWVWRLLVAPVEERDSAVSRVARNSIAPIVLNLFNRGIDFAFAFVMLRILGPEDSGLYYYAIVVFVWFDIFTNFGLDVFVIREVSRNRARSGTLFLNSSVLRLALMLACVPLLLGFLLVRQATIDPPLTNTALLAIGLLYIGLAPGSLSKGLTSVFYAFEKAEIPAAVTTITTMNKAVLGILALLLGYGIVGLAGVSIVVNLVTLGVLLWAARGLIRPARTEDVGTQHAASLPDETPLEVEGAGRGVLPGHPYTPDAGLIRSMTREGFPLMLNHFLATIFFQIDIVILEAMRGAVIVGKYSVAYRWLLALNIIPAFFTQALLPVMSRQAAENRDALRRTYTLGIKILLCLALPCAVMMTFLADALTLFLGGQQFMPEGAAALQIMIWSIPIGWMNSLTQYVLIALDLQRRITRAFVVAVTFNIVTNLIFIPQYGFRAAAVTTILSELVLLVPFGLLMQSALGRLDWWGMMWRPVAAAGAMLAVLLVGWAVQPVLALVAGGMVYVGVLLMLKPLSADERAVLAPLLPGRIRRVL